MASTSFSLRGFRGRILVLCIGGLIFFYFLVNSLTSVEDDSIHDLHHNKKDSLPSDKLEHPILIWWTPFTGEQGNLRHCGADACFFTEDRQYFNHSLTKGFLFYGTDFKPTDLPVPRKISHDWALLHEESPKNNYLFSTKQVMELFNHTATFRRQSDLPLTLQYLDSLKSLTSQQYFVPTAVKNSRLREMSPVVYVQSDCDTPSDRDAYVKELMKYVAIDSYGKCLHNKELPDSRLSDPISGMDHEEFWHILAQYKFSLAFENAICEDYITEKLWRPLIIGSVPIYYGSSTIKDWLPNPKSAISVNDFQSPKELAQFLKLLNNNNTLYESYLDHKIKGEITNNLLKHALEERQWGINSDFEKENFIEYFECLVCERINKNLRSEKLNFPLTKFQATLDHYGCPEPVSPLTKEPDSHSWWLEMHRKALYEAEALSDLLSEHRNFTADQFYGHVIKLLEAGHE